MSAFESRLRGLREEYQKLQAEVERMRYSDTLLSSPRMVELVNRLSELNLQIGELEQQIHRG